jgi:ribonuclease D
MIAPIQALPTIITRSDDLLLLTELLHHEPVVAVDTESNSLFAYREQVCLIQFSTPQGDFLIDPLVLRDLSPLESLFKSPAVEKVFHAAEYDLICLSRDFGFQFANLFDSMVASRILGRQAVGLGAILETEFGVQLDKHGQRANWGERPLPTQLLDYARHDTHYLIALKERLEAELEQRGLLALATEDFNRLCAIPFHSNNSHLPDDKNAGCWHVSGSYSLEDWQAAVLLELCRYREQVAKSLNRPLFKVIGDSTLLAIAENTPRNLEQLKQLPGMSEKQLQRHGQKILQVVQRGLRCTPINPPRPPRPDETYLGRLEALRSWRKAAGEKMGVASDVVLPRDLLFNLAERNPLTPNELAEALKDVPWRLEHFGEQILSVLSKQEKTGAETKQAKKKR